MLYNELSHVSLLQNNNWMETLTYKADIVEHIKQIELKNANSRRNRFYIVRRLTDKLAGFKTKLDMLPIHYAFTHTQPSNNYSLGETLIV